MTHLNYVPEDVEYLDGTIAAAIQQHLDEIDEAIAADEAATLEQELQFWSAQ